jgi:hypothetical protein
MGGDMRRHLTTVLPVIFLLSLCWMVPVAEARWSQAGSNTCSTSGCHPSSGIVWQTPPTIAVATRNITAGQTSTLPYAGAISASTGDVLEIDWRYAGFTTANYDNAVIWVPDGWTVAQGTAAASGVPGWNTRWDLTDTNGVAGAAPVWTARATDWAAPGTPTQPSGGYHLDFGGTIWDGAAVSAAKGANLANDSGAGTDQDLTLNVMGTDARVTVPAGAAPGTYHIHVYGAGKAPNSGGQATKGSVLQIVQVIVTAGGDTTPPTVLSSTPVKNEPSAPLNGAVTINFSEPIDCTTVNTTNVTMTAGGWSLGSCGGSTAVFNTSGQTGSTFYTVTVTTAVKDLAGNPLDPSNTFNVIGYITSAAATPPDTFMTAPAAAAVLSGATFNITGTATPGTNPVAGVQLSTNNGGIWNAATGTESWSYLWTLPAEDFVSHTLLAKAVDNTALEDLTPRSVSITVDTVAPAGLANSAPVNGGTGVSTGSSLLAVAATDGNPTVEYLFELAGDAAFTVAPQASSWQAGSSWAPVLAGGTTYYWRVSVRDGAGNLAGPTATWTFQTAVACSRLDPTVTILTASREVTVDGGFADYTVQLTNNDSAACGNTTFNLTVSDSNGTNFYPSTLAQSALLVVPGGSSQTTFRVTAKANQTNGTTNSSYANTAADGNHAQSANSNSVITTINVLGGGCVDNGSYLNANGDQLSTSR